MIRKYQQWPQTSISGFFLLPPLRTWYRVGTGPTPTPYASPGSFLLLQDRNRNDRTNGTTGDVFLMLLACKNKIAQSEEKNPIPSIHQPEHARSFPGRPPERWEQKSLRHTSHTRHHPPDGTERMARALPFSHIFNYKFFININTGMGTAGLGERRSGGKETNLFRRHSLAEKKRNHMCACLKNPGHS